jgi:hypothetical protein
MPERAQAHLFRNSFTSRFAFDRVNNTKSTTPFENFRKTTMARAIICIRNSKFSQPKTFNSPPPIALFFANFYLMDEYVFVIVVPKRIGERKQANLKNEFKCIVLQFGSHEI